MCNSCLEDSAVWPCTEETPSIDRWVGLVQCPDYMHNYTQEIVVRPVSFEDTNHRLRSRNIVHVHVDYIKSAFIACVMDLHVLGLVVYIVHVCKL